MRHLLESMENAFVILRLTTKNYVLFRPKGDHFCVTHGFFKLVRQILTNLYRSPAGWFFLWRLVCCYHTVSNYKFALPTQDRLHWNIGWRVWGINPATWIQPFSEAIVNSRIHKISATSGQKYLARAQSSPSGGPLLQTPPHVCSIPGICPAYVCCKTQIHNSI